MRDQDRESGWEGHGSVHSGRSGIARAVGGQVDQGPGRMTRVWSHSELLGDTVLTLQAPESHCTPGSAQPWGRDAGTRQLGQHGGQSW